jgi:hypothetical protein
MKAARYLQVRYRPDIPETMQKLAENRESVLERKASNLFCRPGGSLLSANRRLEGTPFLDGESDFTRVLAPNAASEVSAPSSR